MASRIEDYGFISSTQTGALISKTGALDWLCMPRFDSDACFAALLGFDRHGTWWIEPTAGVRRRRQRYRGDTLILESDIVCDGGSVRLTEFMPVPQARNERSEVIRMIDGVQGEVPMRMFLSTRFGYGANRPWAIRVEGGFRLVAGPDSIVLRGPIEMNASGADVVSYFPVKRGDRIGLTLTWYPSHEAEPEASDVDAELERCERFWLEWAGRCAYQGTWRDAVVRSLITLKGLTYAPTGAIVAAPTTGLPEDLGGVRNWDYRFCWVRDATLTLHAMMLGGYIDEAREFRDWLLRAAAGAPSEMQIMYKIDGSRRLTEYELPWLPGYEDSKPVRVGNAAYDQFQLDVYGELLGAVYQARQLGLPPHPESLRTLEEVVRFVARTWQQPDDGIWEVRGGRKHFTHSKVMAWVAIDRATRIIEQNGDNGGSHSELLQWLRALRERIHEEIMQRAFHPKVNAFTQHYGAEVVDASALLIPHSGLLPATDPRMLGTVAAVERTLLHDGLVLRYSTEHGVDGLAGSEGAFLACSFWLCDNYALSGQIEKAEELFEKLLALRTPLGLLSEEYDAARNRLVGNFPQGFSHLALISSANTIGLAKKNFQLRDLAAIRTQGARGTGPAET
jgi:GH15 family glucan-1,4-alpha-glucosidase